jgi:hypothetical protein
MVKLRAPRTLLVIGIVLGAILLVALTGAAGTTADDEQDGRSVRGAGTTMVEGGTGPPSFKPIITKVAFYWKAGAGHFECLALAPSEDAGRPGSGNFDTNIMYVTGPITSAVVKKRAVVLKGSSTVTGAGAGSNRPFTATITRGGPGATLVLKVSGLTFREILLEGSFNF